MIASRGQRLLWGIVGLYLVFEALWIIPPYASLWGSSGLRLALVLTAVKAGVLALLLLPLRRDDDSGSGAPRRGWRQALLRYGLAIIAPCLALYLRASFGDDFGQRPLLILFILPIIVCALQGGVGPGLLATLITVVGVDLLFVPPLGRLGIAAPRDALQWSILLLDGVLVSVLSGGLHRSRQRTRQAFAELEATSARLGESESGLRAIFDASPVALCVSRDDDGSVIDVNPAFLALFDRARADVVGRPLGEQYGGGPARDGLGEFELIRPDGARSVLAAARPITIGGVAHRLTSLIDLSAERRANDAVRRSEQQFRLLVDAVSDLAICLLDPEGRVVSWSVGAATIKGYAADEIVGRSFLCFYTPEDRADGLPQQLLLEASRLGRVTSEGWRLRRDGSRFWARATLYAVGGPDGLLGYGKITRDLSQERAAMKDLRASEALCAGIVGSAMDAIVVIDAAHRIVLFNAAAEAMFGWSAAQVHGRGLDVLLPAAVQTGRKDAFDAIRRECDGNGRQGLAGELFGVRANSELFPLEASIARLDSFGETSYTVILRDISVRRRADAAIERHARQLESLQEMNQVILTAQDPRQVAQLGLRHLRNWVPFWGATAMVFDWERREATVLAIERGDGARYDPGQHVSLESYGLADLDRLRQGEACLVPDLGALDERSATLERLYRQGMHSYLRLPLIADGNLLGALNLASDTVGAFDPVQQQEAEAVAHQLAIMLQQVILRHRIERLNHMYAVLSGINALIVRCHDRDALFQGVCHIAVEAGAFRMAWVGVIDPVSGVGRVAACHGGDSTYRDKIELDANPDSPYARRPSCQAASSGEMVLCNDIAADVSLAELWPDFLHGGLRSVACLPIVVDARVAAVLALFAGEVGAFDSVEVPLLRELAGDIGFALDHIRKEEELDYLAYYDALTGLANRTLFLDRLAQTLSAVGREGRRCALVLADLEHFKLINDVYGRRAGDEVLQQVAARLAARVDDATLLARLSADQFVTVVMDAHSDDEVARRVEGLLRDCLEVPFVLAPNELRLSAKFGVALFPEDGHDAETLLENAEAALKRARATGERFLFYRQEMTERAVAALALENQLRLALARNEFLLYYQPKVDAASREVVGVEALLRWQSPQAGMVEPSRFIPMLEETGLILDVGAWALGQAAEDRQAWALAGLATPRVAVNVSAIQLRRHDFVETVARALAPFGDDPGIDLEITESLIMQDIEHCIVALRAVNASGVCIAIDDFGTGYSSLAYLARLPVQALKIDRAFVNSMLDEEDAMTLVAAIISLAHSLRMEVVAEGVETEAQAMALSGLGCDTMQGYHFSRPVPAERLGAMLPPRGEAAL